MRIIHRADGTSMPAYEPGDCVRLARGDPGPLTMAITGEWGRVLRNRGADGLDIRLAGHSRPRTGGLPARLVQPCDRQGLALMRAGL